MTKFSLEKRIIHHLMLNSVFINDVGLVNGKMGIAIAFYMFGRNTNNPTYSNYAHYLIDNIVDSITTSTTYGFENGLCGLGWGIEYLLQNNYIEGDSLEINEEIDAVIMRTNPSRLLAFDMENGLLGLLNYVLIHLKGSLNKTGICPFDKIYLEDLHVALKNIPIHLISSDLKLLVDQFNNYLISETIPDYFFSIYKIANNQCQFFNQDILSCQLGIKNGLSNYLIYKSNEKILL